MRLQTFFTLVLFQALFCKADDSEDYESFAANACNLPENLGYSGMLFNFFKTLLHISEDFYVATALRGF